LDSSDDTPDFPLRQPSPIATLRMQEEATLVAGTALAIGFRRIAREHFQAPATDGTRD
jgi:hypothetical protein